MKYKVMVAALKPNVTARVVDAAKACGISGATIVPGRGTGMHEAKTFLGLTLETQTDVVFFLSEEDLVQPVMQGVVAFIVGMDPDEALRRQTGLLDDLELFERHGLDIAFVAHTLQIPEDLPARGLDEVGVGFLRSEHRAGVEAHEGVEIRQVTLEEHVDGGAVSARGGLEIGS